jgi:hypothetical protein
MVVDVRNHVKELQTPRDLRLASPELEELPPKSRDVQARYWLCQAREWKRIVNRGSYSMCCGVS